MKYLLVALFLIMGYNGKTQSLSDLDKSNGFKEFHFGDNKKKWISQLIPTTTPQHPNSYFYQGNCCQTAFGSPLNKIILSFDKNDNLYIIFVSFKDNQQAQGQKHLTDVIESAFGKATGLTTQESGNMYFEWGGNVVALFYNNVYKGVDEGGWEMSLIYMRSKDVPQDAKDY